MTHTLELPENVERILVAKARQRGVALEAYMREVLQRDAQVDSDTREPQNVISARLQALSQLQELAKGTRSGLPSIPDEALSRENLYEGCGEIRE